jgi:hypothetical protein
MRSPNQLQKLIEKSLGLMHIAGLWTHVVDNKKQAWRGLKKTVDAHSTYDCVFS